MYDYSVCRKFVTMSKHIYTKTGDKGTTGLFGGKRVDKDYERIQAYGTVDELNAVIGVALTLDVPNELRGQLLQTSADLFVAGSDLATPLDPPPTYPIPRITPEHAIELERRIDAFDEVIQPLRSFILPGGTPLAAHLHLARTVCRRAERAVVTLSKLEEIGSPVIVYLNRLSDYLFTAARMANHLAGVSDVEWKGSKSE